MQAVEALALLALEPPNHAKIVRSGALLPLIRQAKPKERERESQRERERARERASEREKDRERERARERNV